MVRINGEEKEFSEKSLSQCLKEMHFNTQNIVVMIGDNIIKKCDYDTTILHEGDTVEIASFVGGG